MYAFMK
jgi:glucokinase